MIASANHLETAIIDHLQQFLTEMVKGFFFEARQKRITFGNTHYRIDCSGEPFGFLPQNFEMSCTD
jgi:predicted nuclease of restriction endonuclease-like (RecB) superfamily